MNHLVHKCLNCKRSFTPTKIDQKYCCSACRQAAYRKRLLKHRGVRKPPEAKPLIAATCLHCGGSFWAQRGRARFCSTSCRTLHHRALKATIPQALMSLYGIPQDKALDLIDTQPTYKLRSILEASGYVYVHQIRSWEQSNMPAHDIN